MLSHAQVWAAIDALAERYGMSPSGLARRAGLDPTTFNPSKRRATDGRLRWPSTESICWVLVATGASLDEFTTLLDEEGRLTQPTGTALSAGGRSVPLIGLAQAGAGGFFDDGGFPVGAGWDEVAFPEITDRTCYALEVSGDSMLPLYRDGDVIIVSPTASVRRGDRVVVKTVDGEVMAKILARKTTKLIELLSANPTHENRTIPVREIEWIARIIWASQ
ncbi:MAG: helix-turn-helix transcriptional regulator [Hyphomicrobiales bacterium]|nr:helix-turn-helix transcriptional regulator [Hyphomicrobiales bacterium]